MFPVNWYTLAIRMNQIHTAAIGQVEIEHPGGRILWAFDQTNPEENLSVCLLDNLAVEAGLRGLHFLTASSSKDTYAYETFFNAGYSPCTWQKIWLYTQNFRTDEPLGFTWRKARPSDLLSVNLLQNKLLSANEKMIVTPTNQKPPTYILLQDGTICGYVYVMESHNKVMITPIIDPEIPFALTTLKNLVYNYFPHVLECFLLQTASQSWIETALIDQIELIQPRHEIMVKHLTIREKDLSLNFNHSRNSRHTDIVTPIIKSNQQKDNI